jgi:hypothetical protein
MEIYDIKSCGDQKYIYSINYTLIISILFSFFFLSPWLTFAFTSIAAHVVLSVYIHLFRIK